MAARPTIPFLLELLRLALRKEATALYIVPWLPPTLRIDEQTVPLSSSAFAPEQSTRLVLDMLGDAQRVELDRSRAIEFDLLLEGEGCFRVHVFRSHGQPAMTVRPFALDVPTPRTLALPLAACRAAMAAHGLLLLASPSLTLRRDATAALLEHRNRSGDGDLALLDGATRFWHTAARCRVQQGLDAVALDTLLRQRAQAGSSAPALAIAFGELRDAPQFEQVLRACATALCVLTLQADTAAAALQRLLHVLAGPLEHTLRHRLAMQLHALLVLHPVPARAGGVLALTQVQTNHAELARCLSAGELDTLWALLEPAAASTGRAVATATDTDSHIEQLLARRLVTPDVALRHARDADALARRLAAGALHEGPAAPAAPVAVDSGFADLFDSGAAPLDPFRPFDPLASAPLAAFSPVGDTQFDEVDWSSGDIPSRPQAIESLAPAAERHSGRSAQLHAFAAPAVAAGGTTAIDIWVARADAGADVAQLAAADIDPTRGAALIATRSAGPATILQLELQVDGVLHAALTQECRWTGQVQRIRFGLAVPEATPPGACAARVQVRTGGLAVGELSFVLSVQPDARQGTPAQDTQGVRRMVASAFASYAPEDLPRVQACIADLHGVAPDLRVFVDAPRLRHAPGWRVQIEQALGRHERLHLFWSRAAAESPWVDFEWRQVLRRRGAAAIDIVLLEPPSLAPLPPELADLPALLRQPQGSP
ncbi:MAG: TIR domain-containing protein [Rubrivivax sp.]|nr:TIR domain-containing protein [Rubrivivax sp.]